MFGDKSYRQLGEHCRKIEELATELSLRVDKAQLDAAEEQLHRLKEAASITNILLLFSRALLHREEQTPLELPDTDEATLQRETHAADVASGISVLSTQLSAAIRNAEPNQFALILQAAETEEYLSARIQESVSDWFDARRDDRRRAVGDIENVFRALGRNETVRRFIARCMFLGNDRVGGLAVSLGMLIGIRVEFKATADADTLDA